MSDRDLAPRMELHYGAAAATITDASAPAGASSAGTSDAGGIFVLMGVAIGAATIDAASGGILSYDAAGGGAVTFLHTNVGLTGINMMFNMRHASSALVLTGVGGTTPNATMIGYWKSD